MSIVRPVLALLAMAAPWPAARAQTKQAVVQAWRAHQQRIDSASLRWTEHQVHRRDWLPNPRHPEPEHDGDQHIFGDRGDTVLRRLEIAGSRIQVTASIRRGGRSTDTARVTARRGPWNDQHPWAQELSLRPGLLNVRPLDPALGPRNFGRAVVRGIKDSLYRGQALLIVEEPADSAGWKFVLWLDPKRDFVVRRYVLVKEAIEMLFFDIDYFQDAEYGWMPCRWTTTRRKPGGTLWRSDTAMLTALAINGWPRPLPEPATSTARKRTCR